VHVKRSLYDLKQSPRQWHLRFDTCVIEHDYSKSKYDSCVYHLKLNDNSFVYLLLYVDDMSIIAKACLKLIS